MNRFNEDALRSTDFQQPAGFRNESLNKDKVLMDDSKDRVKKVDEIRDEEINFEVDANFSEMIDVLQNINPDLGGEQGGEKILGIANLLRKEWFSEYATNHKLGLENPYNLVVDQGEKLIRYLPESDIVEFAKSGNIHRTVLTRVLDKWSATEGKTQSPEFKKLVRAMVELGYITYGIDKKLQSGLEENVAKFTGVLKNAELFLKEFEVDKTLDLIKQGAIHPSVFRNLLNAYESGQMVGDNDLVSSVKQVVSEQYKYEPYFAIEEDLVSLGSKKVSDSLVERNKVSFKDLNELLNLYTKGKRKDPGGCAQKVRDIIALEIMKGLN